MFNLVMRWFDWNEAQASMATGRYVEVLDARPVARGDYKVDVGRGERIGRVQVVRVAALGADGRFSTQAIAVTSEVVKAFTSNWATSSR